MAVVKLFTQVSSPNDTEELLATRIDNQSVVIYRDSTVVQIVSQVCHIGLKQDFIFYFSKIEFFLNLFN